MIKYSLVAIAVMILAPVVFAAAFLFGRPLIHPPPLMLRHVTAGGGSTDICPPRDEQAARWRRGSPEALSSELDQRLAQQFPPGSQGPMLFQSPMAQGFEQLPACETDSSIHKAMYKGPAAFLADILAVVYWKTNDDNAIVWTKGVASLDSL
jgi:hypothetical protein